MRKKNKWNLPAAVKATIDWALYREKLLRKKGAPFNGQPKRQQIFEDLLRTMDFDRIIETGTYIGSSTVFFAQHFDKPIHTVECVKYFYLFAKKRLKGFRHVNMILGDSVSFLQSLTGNPADTRGRTLFYLDAHWHDHLPLREEVTTIIASFADPVIVIDDFQVPDDPGYGYDDYGNGKALTLSYLGPLHADLGVFFPAAGSRKEEGKKRGSVILAPSGNTVAALKRIHSLRYSPANGSQNCTPTISDPAT